MLTKQSERSVDTVKKLLKLLFSRLAFVALFMLLQIVVIVATLFYFQGAYTAV